MEDLFTLFSHSFSGITIPLYPEEETLTSVVKVLATLHTVSLVTEHSTVKFVVVKTGVDVHFSNKNVRHVEVNVALHTMRILMERHNYLPVFLANTFGDNKYRLIDILGRGTTSYVYKGVSTDGKIVALKVYKTAEKSLQQSAINREVQILKVIKAENKCHLALCYEDYFISTVAPVLVTTYVSGVALDTLRRTLPLLPLEKKLSIVKQILQACKYLHARGIAHRDIKLGNILYATDETIRMLDFGFSCFIGECKGVAGTPRYMDPAVNNHREEYKYNPLMQFLWTKADIWSVGVVTFMVDSPVDHDVKKPLLEQLSTMLTQEMLTIATYMLVLDPKERPSAEVVLLKFF